MSVLIKIVAPSEVAAIRSFVAAASAGWFAGEPHPGPLWARLFLASRPPLDATADELRRILDAASDLAVLAGGVALGTSYDDGISHATCSGTSLRCDGPELTIAGGSESVSRKVAAAVGFIHAWGDDDDED